MQHFFDDMVATLVRIMTSAHSMTLGYPYFNSNLACVKPLRHPARPSHRNTNQKSFFPHRLGINAFLSALSSKRASVLLPCAL